MPENKTQLMDLRFALECLSSYFDYPDDTDGDGSIALKVMGSSSSVEQTMEEIKGEFANGREVVHMLVTNEESIQRARQLAACLRSEGLASTEQVPSANLSQTGIVYYVTFSKDS